MAYPTGVRKSKIDIMEITKRPEVLRMTKKDQKVLTYVLDRFQKMDDKRGQKEDKRDKIDKNFYYTPTMSGQNKEF
jgi:hypothetical protein